MSVFNHQPQQEFSQNVNKRQVVGKIWHGVFFFSTLVAIVALSILLITIINQAFGLVVLEYRVDPASLIDKPLEEATKDELTIIIRDNLKSNRVRTLEREKPLEERSYDDLFTIVEEQILKPDILESYNLIPSVFNRQELDAEISEKYPDATVIFKYWLNQHFLERGMSSRADLAGIRIALLGSINLILITITFAFPIGVSAAIYLEEYARKDIWINRVIQINIDNLAGVPSIVYGILGLAIFVRTLQPITSGAIFGSTATDNGRTILSAGLTMGLLILPVIIINAQEAIRAVPDSLRQASYGLGGTQWQTIWSHVLPQALPGILTGTILAISRAIGETAPLILVGASTFITTDPRGLFSPFSALPIQIYNWTAMPQGEFRNIAAAAIIVLLVTLLALNAFVILLRNRFSKRQI
jgi:phosphate transport system permease protein